MFGAVVACVVSLAALPTVSVARQAPAADRAWLGDWKTNFGELWFYSLGYTDITWDGSGKEYSSCLQLRECHYHWLLRGLWHWPLHGWVPVKGTPDGKEPGTMEPCWEGPLSATLPGLRGNGCFVMLLYRYRDKEQGGFWKACFLPENCTDHHYLHGTRVAEHGGDGGLWKVGFSFTQKGRPDAHHVISTQTGGAGTVIFSQDPSTGARGEAAEGSLVFHIDNLGAAPEPSFTVTLERGSAHVDRSARETVMELGGFVSSSNDGRCRVGALIRITIYQRHNPSHPNRVRLQAANGFERCQVNETWTSTDRRRVSVHIDAPLRVP
jgi:hypothetical protein